MKYNCLYCQKVLLKGMDNLYCIYCPIKVEYYTSQDNKIYIIEMAGKNYLVSIYLLNYDDTPILNDEDMLYISFFTNGKYQKLTFNNDFGITSTNIEQKLQTLLTFQ